MSRPRRAIGSASTATTATPGRWSGNTVDGDLVVAARRRQPESSVQGLRYSTGVQTPVRALEDWDETERRVGAWYHATQLKLRLDFTSGLQRHAPPLRARLVDRARRAKLHRGRRHDDQDDQRHDRLRPGRLDALPDQRPGGWPCRHHRRPDSGHQRPAQWPLPRWRRAPPAPGPSPTPPEPQPLTVTDPSRAPSPSPSEPAPAPARRRAHHPRRPESQPEPESVAEPVRAPVAKRITPRPPPITRVAEPQPVASPSSPRAHIGPHRRAIGSAPTAMTATLSARGPATPRTTIGWPAGRRDGHTGEGARVSAGRPDPGPRPREPGRDRAPGRGLVSRTQLKLRLDFATPTAARCTSTPSTGLDDARRANYTVADGTTTKMINVTTAFDQGAWMHFPISVPAGGHVDITADRTAGNNVLLNGLFLGGAGAPPARPGP